MKTINVFVIATLAAFAIACGEGRVVDPDGIDHGNCTVVSYNEHWPWRLVLHHTDTRSCPVGAHVHDIVTAGGTLDEEDAEFPSSNIDTRDVSLYIRNTNYQCQDVGSVKANATTLFNWAHYDNDETWDWVAGIFAQYEAGTGGDPNRDCATFYVTLLNSSNTAVAVTVINYWANDM
jgi:hypothetical protein